MKYSKTVDYTLQDALNAIDNFEASNTLNEAQSQLWLKARDNIRQTMAMMVAIEALD